MLLFFYTLVFGREVYPELVSGSPREGAAKKSNMKMLLFFYTLVFGREVYPELVSGSPREGA